MSSTDALKTIRKEIARSRGVSEGTVVRFTRTIAVKDFARDVETGETREFRYAAIYAGGGWYLTGTSGMGVRRYTNRDFFDLMADSTISNVEVATEFEAV